MPGSWILLCSRYPVIRTFGPSPATAWSPRYGTGIHTCLGTPLARLETRIALRAFTEHVESVQLDPANSPTRLDDKDIGMWGFTRLPVRIAGTRSRLPAHRTSAGGPLP